MPIGRGIMIKQRFTVFQTVTTITSKNPPSYSVCNQTVTYNVSVTPGFVPDGGTVQLIDTFDNSILATGTLSSGTTSINYAFPSDLEPYQVAARYVGANGNPDGYSISQSSINNQEVRPDGYLTVTIGTIPSTVCFGNDYGITATVTSAIAANNPINDGYVRFIGDNGGALFTIDGYCPVVAGVATGVVDGYDGYTMVWPNIPRPAVFPITAEYYPDTYCFAQTNSNPFNVTVQGYSTTTTIQSVDPEPFSASAGGTVTITAMVTSAEPGTINGNVLFETQGGSVILGTGSLSAGTATITPLKSAFGVGLQQVTARFFGDYASGDCFEPSSDGYNITVTA